MGAPQPLPFTAGDLIIFPVTVRHMDEGGSTYSQSPYDPARLVHISRSFNYPRIWLILPRLGLTEANVGTWRLVACTVFFLTVILMLGEMNLVSGLVVGAAICSPAIMFGVERGNVDQWLFIVLAAAIICFGHRSFVLAGYGLLLFAAILKLYPAVTFVTVLREQTWRRRAMIALGLAASFAGYLYWIRSDLKTISRVTPQMVPLSFGREVLFFWLSHLLGGLNRQENIASIGLLIASLGVAFFAALRIRRRHPLPILEHQPSLTAFWIGALTFAAVFVTASNFNYRLVFLLFTQPQILIWVRRRDSWGAISTVALLALLATLWLIQAPRVRVILTQLSDWTLFTYFVTALLVTLPLNFAKAPLEHRRRSHIA
jgi:hypothetical protein